MTTKYDVFEIMHEEGGPLKPPDILRYLKKPLSSYHMLYQILLEMEKGHLICKGDRGFQAIRSKKNDLLYRLISFCIENDINYNNLLDKNIAKFISEAITKKRIFIKDFKLNSRTFAKYIEILSRSGMLIIISKKPLTGTVIPNSFIMDLLLYFGHKPVISKMEDDEYITEIEKELQRFRKLKKKNERKYAAINDAYEIRFIQHSLNLEGNPITLPETLKVLKDKIIPRELKLEMVQEVQNYQQAVKQMLKESGERKTLTKESILNYHFISMQHRPEIAGQIRKVPVFIKNNLSFKVAEVSEIEMKLDKLFKKYNTFIMEKKHSLKEILEFSAFFHNEFQHIHPFVDGNSRTARILAFYLLRSFDIPIIDIPLGLLEKYLFSTKGAKKRHDKELGQTLQQIILYNLKVINEQLRQ